MQTDHSFKYPTLLRPSSGDIQPHICEIARQTADASETSTPGPDDYNCLGFCLGVRACVDWLKDRDGSPSAEKTLRELGFREAPLASSESGTTIVLYEAPNASEPGNYLHVIKQLRGELYESKCGWHGPRIVLRRPRTWYKEEGKELQGQRSTEWFLLAADHKDAIAKLESCPKGNAGPNGYRIAATRSSSNAPRRLPDVLGEYDRPVDDILAWLEKQIPHASKE